MYQGGEALARDAGYLSYARRGEVGNASNHNMMLGRWEWLYRRTVTTE